MSSASSANGLNIVFAGTPEFAACALRALLDDGSHSVRAVYCQPDRPAGRGKRLQASPVKLAAQRHGIAVYQPKNFRNPADVQQLQALQADALVVAAYGLLLPKTVLDIPLRGCINIHASLLPRWRGAAPIERAIEAGDAETGISIMQMDEGLDTGPVLSTASCPIDATETGDSLRAKLATIGASLLLQTLPQLANGSIQPRQQDDTGATYASKIDKQELQIDWRLPASVVERKLRAFFSANTMFTQLDGTRIKIAGAEPENAAPQDAAPGTIIDLRRDALLVACGEGALLIKQLQLPGGKMLAVRDVLNARKSLFSRGRVFENAA